jgi:hypothetical protein
MGWTRVDEGCVTRRGGHVQGADACAACVCAQEKVKAKKEAEKQKREAEEAERRVREEEARREALVRQGGAAPWPALGVG